MVVIAAIVGTTVALAGGYLVGTARGMHLKKQLQDPFDASALSADGGRFVTTVDGRVVEYFVWGSQRPDAKVLVLCHGSAMTANIMVWLYRNDVLVAQNIKAIGITYPGHGYSDLQVPRRIADWPLDDVHPVLKKEGAKKFMVQGWSYGTAHAMACGVHFGPEVCVAIGLNCPYLSNDVCKEFSLPDNSAALPTIADVNRPRNACIFALLDTLNKPLISRAAAWIPEGKLACKEQPELFEMMRNDIIRGCVRGTAPQVYEEYTLDTTGLWGFDPRDMKTKHVAVWYADDDTAVPPSHGKWLADTFGAMDHVQVDVRCSKSGHGHFSYVREPNLAEGIQTKVLMEMAGSRLL